MSASPLNVSTLRARRQTEHSKCGICLAEFGPIFMEKLKACDNPSHRFCRTCMKQYFSSKVEEGQLVIVCPGLSCTKQAVKREIREFTTNAEYRVFRLNTIKSDPSYRECSHCHKALDFLGLEEMICACGSVECFTHGGAHPHESCSDHVNRNTSELTVLSDALVQKITKKCPKCGVNTEKNGGCDHMVSDACTCTFMMNALTLNILSYSTAQDACVIGAG